MTGTIKTYYSFLRFLKSQRRKVAALQLSGKLEHWLISSTAQLVLETRASSKPSALPPTEYQIWIGSDHTSSGIVNPFCLRLIREPGYAVKIYGLLDRLDLHPLPLHPASSVIKDFGITGNSVNLDILFLPSSLQQSHRNILPKRLFDFKELRGAALDNVFDATPAIAEAKEIGHPVGDAVNAGNRCRDRARDVEMPST